MISLQNETLVPIVIRALMEGFKVSDANLVVYVHPSKSTKVPQAVLRELSSLEGKVVKLTQTSIHVIVGFSSAVITDEDIREEFKYKSKHLEELYASRFLKRHVIRVGTMIRFLVKRSTKRSRESEAESVIQEHDTGEAYSLAQWPYPKVKET